MSVREQVGADRGQVAPLLAIVVLVAGAACLFIAHLGALLVDRARAQTSADAAALAAAVEGRSGAVGLAQANEAELESYRTVGDVAAVEVRVRRVTATASAQAGPLPVFAGLSGGDRVGLAPVMLAALARADALLGRPVPVVSGFRNTAQQRALWLDRANRPFPVARPGTSAHERGMAVDVPREVVPFLLAAADEVGLCQPLPDTDPIHFEPCLPISRN